MGFPRNEFITRSKEEGHSLEFILEALTYAERLDGKELPVIFDFPHLAFLLGLDVEHLLRLIGERTGHYRYFTIRKRTGGFRRIIAPYSDLREVQEWIKSNILDNVKLPAYVTAFAKGRSTFLNAKMHENKEYILKVDLKDFFESINARRICAMFKWLGYEGNVASCLTTLCTTKLCKYKYKQLADEPEKQQLFSELAKKEEPFLAQGSPCSPAIANIVCGRLDKRLNEYANKHGINYSRYADDITFSSNDKDLLPKISFLKRVIHGEGFELNESKTCLVHAGQKQVVTGLLVDSKVRVPGRYKRDIMRHIHFCKKYGGKGHFHKIAPGKAFGKEWIEGRIRYVASIEPETAKRMWTEFEQIDWVK